MNDSVNNPNQQIPDQSIQQQVKNIYISKNNTQSDSFLSRLKPGKSVAVLSLLLIVAAIPVAMHLLSNPTNPAIKASGGASLTINGNLSYSIGQKVNLTVALDPGGNAVTATKLIITYNQNKLKRDVNALVPNIKAFPTIVQGPIYDTCVNSICAMAVDLSIGSNPTQILTTIQNIATLHFTALQTTGTNGTSVAFDGKSEVFSASGSVGAQKSVVTAMNAITLSINPSSITGSPTPSLTTTPTTSVSLTPTSTISPTTTITPNPSGGTTTPTATPTPPQGVANTFLNISLKLELPVDASTGAIVSPQNPVRQATTFFYKPGQNPTDSTIQPLYTFTDSVTYNVNTNLFENHKFKIGKIPTGTYQILLKTNQYLRKLISQGISIQNSQTVTIGTITPYIGDIMPQMGQLGYGDNRIDFTDYSLVAACFGSNASSSNCLNANAADLDNSGSVDGIDQNLILRSIANIYGEGPANLPQPTSIASQANDTKISVMVFLDGIGNAGDNTKRGSGGNMNPKHPTRDVGVWVTDTLNNLITSTIGSVTFDATQGAFTGTIDLGTLATGGYTIRIKSSHFLREIVPGRQNITFGKVNTIPPVYLVAGDLSDNNMVGLKDYSILISCYDDLGLSQQNCTSTQKTAADMNDDGIVDLADYNLLIREYNVHPGD